MNNKDKSQKIVPKYINIPNKNDKINVAQFIIEKFYHISDPNMDINILKKHIFSYIQSNLTKNDTPIFFTFNNESWETVGGALDKVYNNVKILRISSDVASFINDKLSYKDDKFILDQSRYIFMGMDEFEFNNFDIRYIKNKTITKKGIHNISEYVKSQTNGNNIHLSIDVGSISESKNFTIETLFEIIKDIEIVSIDFTNLFKMDQVNFTKKIIKQIFNVSEKKINIFTEHTRFIIYRPVEQNIDNDIDPQNQCDIGWYILRFIPLETKTDIIEKLKNDDITTLTIDGEDYYVTTTSINEQNSKSYYTAKSIIDICLFPAELKDMCFELIN